VALAVLVWFLTRPRGDAGGDLVLRGNVDLRQVELTFNANERIAEVLVQEGDRVRKGDVLARLDASRLEPQAAQAEAQTEAARQILARLSAGSRREEVAQAEANLAAARAEETEARTRYERLEAASRDSGGRAVSRQAIDDAKAEADVAAAKRAVVERALELVVAGPRREEIAEAKARVAAAEAEAALVRRQLDEVKLVAPTDAVVRTRVLEPGEMASPQRTVLSLTITDPKWVRAWVTEPDLVRVRPGMRAGVTVDGFPGTFDAWVGFVSPVAEFTPKTVQTDELRPSLVYEVRVFVKDPADTLREGMPATVRVPRDQPPPIAPDGGIDRPHANGR
jgi:membrane fusion protein PltH